MSHPKLRTVADAKKLNASKGFHWFEKETMRFFNTRIHGRNLIGGRYFITSERMDERFPYRYSVRKINLDGSVDTIGDFRQHASLEAAKKAAKQLSKLGEGVPNNPVKDGFDKETIGQNIRLLMREGREQAQAVAIALDAARRSYRETHPRGRFPKHLQPKGYTYQPGASSPKSKKKKARSKSSGGKSIFAEQGVEVRLSPTPRLFGLDYLVFFHDMEIDSYKTASLARRAAKRYVKKLPKKGDFYKTPTSRYGKHGSKRIAKVEAVQGGGEVRLTIHKPGFVEHGAAFSMPASLLLLEASKLRALPVDAPT